MAFWRVRNTLRTELVGLLIAAAALAIFASVAVSRLIGQARLVEHTYAAMYRLSSAMHLMNKAEAGLGSYLSTNQLKYLDQYKSAVEEVPQAMDQLHGNTLTPEGRRWYQLGLILVRNRLNDLRTTARMSQSSGAASAQRYFQSREIESSKDAVVSSLRVARHRLINKLHTRLHEQARDANLLNVALLLLGLFIVALLAVLLQSVQQALESARLKSEFVANLSHEMRTPLSGILKMSELFQTESDPAETRELASDIHSSAEYLMCSLNDIIDFAKLEAGELEIDAEQFSPTALVDEVKALVKREADQKLINVEAFVHSDVPILVLADRSKTKRALLHLVSNAVKFTDAGRVRISMVMRAPAEQRLLHVAVIDSGIGVPTNRRSLIGEPFVQLDGANTRKNSGLGLGLSIAERLVELMGGSTGFVTKSGRGSAFWFDVPIA